MSAGGKARVTLFLAALTVVVLALSVPGSLRAVLERGGLYVLSPEFFLDLPKRLFGPGRFRFGPVLIGVPYAVARAAANRVAASLEKRRAPG